MSINHSLLFEFSSFRECSVARYVPRRRVLYGTHSVFNVWGLAPLAVVRRCHSVVDILDILDYSSLSILLFGVLEN